MVKIFLKINKGLFTQKIIFIIVFLSALSFSAFSQETNISLEEKVKKMEKLIQELEKKQKAQEVMSQLKQTDEEKKDKEEDILDAAGREYTLATPGKINISYSLEYTGDTYDVLRQLTDENDKVSTEVRHVDTHELTNAFDIKYPLKRNITFSARIPFEAKYSATSKDSASGTGAGDPSISVQYQPFKSSDKLPNTILSTSLTFPLGTNPFDIDSDDELATGDGRYVLSGGINFSKTIDPIMAFGGISYSHYFPVDGLDYNPDEEQKAEGYYVYKVDYGDAIGFNIGMGYSLSYMVAVSMSYQYSHSMPTDYYWKIAGKNSSSSSSSSTFSIGTNWRINHKRSFNTDLSIGLYNNNSDVSFSINIPFEFRI